MKKISKQKNEKNFCKLQARQWHIGYGLLLMIATQWRRGSGGRDQCWWRCSGSDHEMRYMVAGFGWAKPWKAVAWQPVMEMRRQWWAWICGWELDDWRYAGKSVFVDSGLGFLGPKFTWCNKQEGASLVKESLDRALATHEWLKTLMGWCLQPSWNMKLLHFWSGCSTFFGVHGRIGWL